MKRFIVYIIFLFLAVALGLVMRNNPSYILFLSRHWTVQIPLWVGITLFFVGVLLLYWLAKLIHLSGYLSRQFVRWINRHKALEAMRLTTRGFLQLCEGDFIEGEQFLLNGLNETPEPLVNYLALAYTAQQEAQYDKRDHYLARAMAVLPQAEFALSLLQARWQLARGQHEQALAILQRLHLIHPKHAYLQRYLYEAYLAVSDWSSLAALLPELKRGQILPAESLESLSEKISVGLLSRAQTVEKLQHYWNQISSDEKNRPEVFFAYAKRLEDLKVPEVLQHFIQRQWKRAWQPELLPLFLNLPLPEAEKFSMLSGFIVAGVQNAALALACAQLAEKLELWGQAREYYEQASVLNPSAEVYQPWAALLQRLGQTDKALACYQQGLAALKS